MNTFVNHKRLKQAEPKFENTITSVGAQLAVCDEVIRISFCLADDAATPPAVMAFPLHQPSKMSDVLSALLFIGGGGGGFFAREGGGGGGGGFLTTAAPVPAPALLSRKEESVVVIVFDREQGTLLP